MGEEKVLLPYQQRVIEELIALDTRITSLNTFLEGEIFLKCEKDVQDLMVKQINVMEEYSHILDLRIKKFYE